MKAGGELEGDWHGGVTRHTRNKLNDVDSSSDSFVAGCSLQGENAKNAKSGGLQKATNY